MTDWLITNRSMIPKKEILSVLPEPTDVEENFYDVNAVTLDGKIILYREVPYDRLPKLMEMIANQMTFNYDYWKSIA
jgi:hypothetical protein